MAGTTQKTSRDNGSRRHPMTFMYKPANTSSFGTNRASTKQRTNKNRLRSPYRPSPLNWTPPSPSFSLLFNPLLRSSLSLSPLSASPSSSHISFYLYRRAYAAYSFISRAPFLAPHLIHFLYHTVDRNIIILSLSLSLSPSPTSLHRVNQSRYH